MKHDWRGASGRSYSYTVHPIGWRPAANQKGNYIFAKQIGPYWEAIYIGQGDLQDRYDAAVREGCVTRKGATHYHEHLRAREDERRQEERDLISGNAECRAPKGCNGVD